MIMLMVAMSVGYVADAALTHLPGMEDDTHALDTLTRPYGAYAVNLAGSGWKDLLREAFRHVQPIFVRSIGVLAAVLLLGIVLRWRQVPFFSGDVAAASERAKQSAVWGQAIPARWLGLLGVVGLLATLVLLTFIYFPPADELFEEMRIVRTNAAVAINTSEFDIAERELNKFDGFISKLPTSLLIRGQRLNSGQLERQEQLRRLVTDIRQAIGKSDRERAKELTRQLFDAAVAYRQLCLAGATP
jgi:hypothetical protein